MDIRNRGHGTRAGSGNDQNYNISFPSGHTWMGLTATDINFNISYSQVAGSLIFQLAGLEAPDQTGVVVRVNGTNYADTGSLMYGLYTGKEGYDGNFTANHYPDDPAGDLYVGHYTSSDSANLRYEGTDPNVYRQVYIKQTNSSADDFSDLIHMLDVLNNTANGPNYFATVSSVINVNQWMRYIAADQLCVNAEGGLFDGVGDDYGLYRGLVDTRFQMVPWDLDTLFNWPGGYVDPSRDFFTGYQNIPGLGKLFNDPTAVQLYYQNLLDLCNTTFSPTTFNPAIEQLLTGWVPTAAISSAESAVAARRAAALLQVPHGAPTASARLRSRTAIRTPP